MLARSSPCKGGIIFVFFKFASFAKLPIKVNSIFSSRQISWLRARRNSIVHHEGPTDGLLGGEKEEKVLLHDANKSVQIIDKFLKSFFR